MLITTERPASCSMFARLCKRPISVVLDCCSDDGGCELEAADRLLPLR